MFRVLLLILTVKWSWWCACWVGCVSNTTNNNERQSSRQEIQSARAHTRSYTPTPWWMTMCTAALYRLLLLLYTFTNTGCRVSEPVPALCSSCTTHFLNERGHLQHSLLAGTAAKTRYCPSQSYKRLAATCYSVSHITAPPWWHPIENLLWAEHEHGL